MKFNELLRYYLVSGTRPKDSLKQGREWTTKEFADQLGITTRVVRYWLKGERLPDDLETIERILFGVTQSHYKKERIALRLAQKGLEVDLPQEATASNQSSTSPTFWGLPSRLQGFYGRSIERSSLAEKLNVDDAPNAFESRRVAIHGMSGVGKTSLALEYAFEYRTRYKGVAWFAGDRRSTLKLNMADFAGHIAPPDTKFETVDAALKFLINEVGHERQRWLWLFDNVASPDDLRDLLPSAGVDVVVTSTFKDWGDWAEEIPLEPPKLEEAADILKNRSGIDDHEGALRLAAMLGCLPLALNQAAALCKRLGISFDDYVDEFENVYGRYQPGLAYAKNSNDAISDSISRLVDADPGVKPVVFACAYCATDPIPLYLIESIAGSTDSTNAPHNALISQRLCKPERLRSGSSAISFHVLTKTAALHLASGDPAAEHYLKDLAQSIATQMPTDGHENPDAWGKCDEIVPHLRSVSNEIEPAQIDDMAAWTDALDSAGGYYFGRGFYEEAEPFLQRAFAWRQEFIDPNGVDTATSANNLGYLYRSMGKSAEALPLVRRALRVWRKQLGLNHPLTAQGLNNVGSVLQDLGYAQRARPFFEQALEVRQRIFSGHHPAIGESLNNLGGVYRDLGMIDEARNLFRRAVEVGENQPNLDNPNLARRYHNLAMTFFARGEASRALEYLNKAEGILKRVLGRQDPRTSFVQISLAEVKFSQGNTESAESLILDTLTALDRSSDRGHPWTKKAARLAADVLSKNGKKSQAGRIRERYVV